MSDAVGRETITIFEIDQPQCSRTYADGVGSPSTNGCFARLGVTGDNKCYNTRATCQDSNNYDPTDTVTLRFARPQEGLLQYGPIMASMVSLHTEPLAVNLAAMDKGSTALGRREVVKVKFTDHQHSDHQVDKYRLERKTGAAAAGSPVGPGFDPYEQGTFWGKWSARNPYYSAYNCRVYVGEVGDAIEDMRVRYYMLDAIEGPNDGAVTLTASDLFGRIEARKAVAPTPSRGELSADISAAAGSFTVTPAGIVEEDYPANTGSPSELRVAIGDEVIRCSRSAATFTVIQRGDLGTTAAAHKQEDLVQLVLTYTAQLPQDIVYDLLANYSEIPTAQLPIASWDLAAVELTEQYTTHIAKPEPVVDLIGELCEQAGFTVWPDVSTGLIEFRALRSAAPTATLDDEAWTIEGSLSIKRVDAKRVSQVWVYYGLINPMEGLDDRRNYHSRLVVDDPDAEGDEQYGTAAIRTIFSRWIPQFGRTFAQRVGERIVAMFRDPPLEARLRIDATREGELFLAEYFVLEAAEIQDFTGAPSSATLAVIEIEDDEEELVILAQEVVFDTPTEGPSAGERTIYIENDAYNLNLREIHDSLYPAPDGSEVVRFIVEPAVQIGSTTTAVPALRTGTWPTMATKPTLEFSNPGSAAMGRVQGKAGAPGRGGDYNQNGFDGEAGGDAVLVESLFSIDNTYGELWAGSGGPGGGGGLTESAFKRAGGGAGAGAVGDDPSSGTSGGNSAGGNDGTASTAGTTEAAGTPGLGGVTPTGTRRGGNGGAANGPGTVGNNGEAAQSDAGTFIGTGGTGKAAGNYVNGNSNVTWIATGDRKGNVV